MARHEPDPTLYDATPKDILFLRDELNVLDNPNSVSQFEQLIQYFEQTEHKDFDKYFKNTKSNPLSSKPVLLKPKLPNNDLYLEGLPLFPRPLQDRVIAYWRKRQKELRRPLLRKHWRILHLSNHGYGEQDNNKLAFANRTNNKMNLRKSNRMLSGLPLVDKLKELRRENEQAIYMVKMVRQRELLKLDQVLMAFNRKDASKFAERLSKNVSISRQLLMQVKDKVLSDEPFAEPNREDKEDNEQDYLAYFCNIVSELDQLDLQLDHFRHRSLDAMKDKFFDLKNQAGVQSHSQISYHRRHHPRGSQLCSFIDSSAVVTGRVRRVLGSKLRSRESTGNNSKSCSCPTCRRDCCTTFRWKPSR